MVLGRQAALMRGNLGVGTFRRLSRQYLFASGGFLSTYGIPCSQFPSRYEHGRCSWGVKMKGHQRGLTSGSASGQVGFVGLGNMGSAMATNLIRKGYDVVLFDVDNSKATSLAASTGGTTASCLEELARGTSTVITMLPDTPHVEAVYLGNHAGNSDSRTIAAEANTPTSSTMGCGALLDLVQPGTLVVDSSTIDPIASRKINAAAAARGVTMLDAPVSGGVPAATNAALTFIVGGTEEGMERARPLLMSMGNKVLYCGKAGSGCVAKVCNNLCLAISMVGVSEAMSLGSKMGMDPTVLARVLNASTARCWSSEIYNPYPGVVEGAPSSRGFQGGFAAALMEKDLNIALQAARASSQSLPMGALAHQLYSLWCAHGYASKDFSGIFELIFAESKSENGGKRPGLGGGHRT